MGEQLVIAGAPLKLLSGSLFTPRSQHRPESAWLTRYLDAAERTAARVLEPHAPHTRKAYRAAWRRWGEHCSALQREPLPIDAEELLRHLELLSETYAPNSVRLALAALCALDQAHRGDLGQHARSLRTHPAVRRWLTAWSREHPAAPRRKAPALSVDELDRVLQAAAEPRGNLSPSQHVALYTRDRAMLLMAVCAALRVSELVALQLDDVTRDERGLRVLVRRSKTDQAGEGHLRGVASQARLARCPLEAHRAWLAVRGDAPGPLYAPVSRAGTVLVGRALTVRQAQETITRRGRDAGVVLSSHSARATFATQAAARGRPLHRIADQGGWSSLDVLRGYVRQASLFDDNASSGLLDG